MQRNVISTSVSEEKSKPLQQDLSLRKISRFARNDKRTSRLAVTKTPVNDYGFSFGSRPFLDVVFSSYYSARLLAWLAILW